MAHPTVYSMIKDRLISYFSPTIRVVDYDEIDSDLSQEGSSFIALEDVSGDETLVGIGDPEALCYREESGIQVAVFVPGPQASNAIRNLGEQVRGSLRSYRTEAVRIVRVDPVQLASLNEGLLSIGFVDVTAEYDSHHPHP